MVELLVLLHRPQHHELRLNALLRESNVQLDKRLEVAEAWLKRIR
jgi:hypothetical protein